MIVKYEKKDDSTYVNIIEKMCKYFIVMFLTFLEYIGVFNDTTGRINVIRLMIYLMIVIGLLIILFPIYAFFIIYVYTYIGNIL